MNWFKKLLGIPPKKDKEPGGKKSDEMMVKVGTMNVIVRKNVHEGTSMEFDIQASFEVVGVSVKNPTISTYLQGVKLLSANEEASSFMRASTSDEIKTLIGCLLTSGGVYVSTTDAPLTIKDPEASAPAVYKPPDGKYSN